MQRLLRQTARAASASSSRFCAPSSRTFASAVPRATPIATKTRPCPYASAARRAYSSQPPKGPNQNVKFWPFLIIIAAGTAGYAVLVRGRTGEPIAWAARDTTR